ncbi:MAG: hypothetical protein ACJ749_08515 [Flavisolibacter sp.]
MSEQNQHLDSLRDIKKLMETSSRFISLSGLSGVAAGVCALVAAFIARVQINESVNRPGVSEYARSDEGYTSAESNLVLLAALTFIVAFCLAFLFTYLRSKKTGVPIWGHVARKVMISVSVPMIMGGLVIWRMLDFGIYGFIAPVCLLFYGFGLINASKYTFSEIRYLGYGQIILGAINLWMPGYGLYFWALGFGVLHIVYGFLMWWKNERQPQVA